MKNIFKKIVLPLAACGMMFSATSCSDELDLHPNGWYTYSSYWQTAEDFTVFIYAQMQMFRATYPGQIFFSAGELRAGMTSTTTIDGSGNANPDVQQNLYTASSTQFSNFGDWWGFIANWNLLIDKAEKQDGILTDDQRDGLLAMAYGMRAYSYFQMYKMYGGLPLRLEPDVADGITESSKLFMARSTAEETLNQIKNDVKKSIELFSKSSYRQNSKTYYYWNANASKMLAGQVYLWSGKVATADHAANPADVGTAKSYFEDVVNNGGYSLLPDYYTVWTTPGNKETIFSINYSSMDDKVFTGSAVPITNFLWSRVTGAATGTYWSIMENDGWGKLKDGTANKFGYWYNPETGTSAYSDLWNSLSYGVMRYMYRNAFYFQFDENDHRGDAFYPCYWPNDDESGSHLDNFDPYAHRIAGTMVIKYRPSALDGYQYLQNNNDMAVYRLADAYMALAECCNYEGDNTGVEKYINLVRARAYGENWDVDKYGYKAGTFAQNEVAILHENDKEFYMEGHRWWDLRRLTLVKNGAQTDHLVFHAEGNVGYGLDVANNPWMVEADGNPCDVTSPVMPTDWEYRLLWPLDERVLGSDTLLKQNPGYVTLVAE